MKLIRLFARYGFPFWITAAWDKLLCVLSRGICSTWLKCWLWSGGCRVGAGLDADGWVTVRARKRGCITLGRRVAVNSRFGSNWAGLNHRTVWQVLDEGRIEIGDEAGMSGVILSSRSLIRVGARSMLGAGVRIYDHDFHPLDAMARRAGSGCEDDVRSVPILIGEDVFIGAGSWILKGAEIGNRCIVGAGSVVRRGSYPQDSLICGNPATAVPLKTGR